MNICMSVCMSICMYIYQYMYIYIYISTYIYMYVCIYIYVPSIIHIFKSIKIFMGYLSRRVKNSWCPLSRTRRITYPLYAALSYRQKGRKKMRPLGAPMRGRCVLRIRCMRPSATQTGKKNRTIKRKTKTSWCTNARMLLIAYLMTVSLPSRQSRAVLNQRLLRKYSYLCTSKASKLSTAARTSCRR